ncbi:MAG TPA: hypothetical protein VGT08_06360 [Terracidiphilus sp.]|nr:hypothetical protein [Terracidiphilus sp.]
MTDETKTDITTKEEAGAESGEKPGGAPAEPQHYSLLQLPGLAAIGIYLLSLAGIIIFGVVGGHYPPILLFFPAVFFAACGGLVMLMRWAWALTLGAVFLIAVYNMWIFSSQHLSPALVQGLLNWVFFLYLVRTEVRSKLR